MAITPLASRTPVPGWPASPASVPSVSAHHSATRSLSSTRCGPQIAPATADVVCAGGLAAWMTTDRPASARQMAVVRPATPAPITRASVTPALVIPER
jgi:hypothetical protein